LLITDVDFNIDREDCKAEDWLWDQRMPEAKAAIHEW
jgi:hypothetical protein